MSDISDNVYDEYNDKYFDVFEQNSQTAETQITDPNDLDVHSESPQLGYDPFGTKVTPESPLNWAADQEDFPLPVQERLGSDENPTSFLSPQESAQPLLIPYGNDSAAASLAAQQSWPAASRDAPPYVPGQREQYEQLATLGQAAAAGPTTVTNVMGHQIPMPQQQAMPGLHPMYYPCLQVETDDFQQLGMPASFTHPQCDQHLAKLPVPRLPNGSTHSGSDSSSFTCSDCGQNFSQNDSLVRHRRTKHNASGFHFRCNTCGFDDWRADKVREHCREKHSQLKGFEQFSKLEGQSTRVKRKRGPNRK